VIVPLANHPPEPIDEAGSPDDNSRARVKLARKWAYLISATSYIPLSHAEIERHLRELVDRLYEAMLSEPFSTDPVAGAGTRLVQLNCTGRTSLRCTLDVLGRELVAQPELRRTDRLVERVVVLLATLAADYAEAVRLLTIKRQKSINSTLLKALRHAQRNLEASEARFDELITCSASGIAITDLEGRFIRINSVLREIIGVPTGHPPKLFDLVHPADLPAVRDVYRQLLDGAGGDGAEDMERIARLRLTGPDQRATCVSCTVSLQRNTDGLPRRYVTVVDAVTGLDPPAGPDPFEPDPPGPEVPELDLPGLAHREVHELSSRSGSHFVYNMLTTISMFVRTDPARARELLVDFAEFTRYCCGAADAYVTLGEELRNVDRYLTLEQARFGERLQVSQQISAAVLRVRLPVLLVQGLVENAVRRGIEGHQHSGTVAISVTDSGADCLIVVEDDGMVPDPPEPDAGGPRSGPGPELDEIHGRLRGAFTDNYQLAVDAVPGTGTRISLRVPKLGTAQ
jgi:PAS domain-containing protein